MPKKPNECGKLGGLARSLAKRASSAANLVRARAKRWAGRELAKNSTTVARQEAAKPAERVKRYPGDEQFAKILALAHKSGPRVAACIAEAAENAKRADLAEENGDWAEVAEQEGLMQMNVAAANLNMNSRHLVNFRPQTEAETMQMDENG